MNAIDFALLKRSNQSLPTLMKSLQKENIDTVLRQNNDGIIYGITYVDHKTRCVFNGSHLGKQYSANAILHRCAGEKLQLSEAQSITDQHVIRSEKYRYIVMPECMLSRGNGVICSACRQHLRQLEENEEERLSKLTEGNRF